MKKGDIVKNIYQDVSSPTCFGVYEGSKTVKHGIHKQTLHMVGHWNPEHSAYEIKPYDKEAHVVVGHLLEYDMLIKAVKALRDKTE